MTSGRQYDLVLLGATGWTGKFCAEYIAQNLPTNLRWAIAGRNAKKLSNIVDDLKSSNPDRTPPEIEVAELKQADLDTLVRKTQVLVTTIGPYHSYGEPAFRACAKNGTHYVDCTGEIPWYREMIGKYQEAALDSGAIMIPQSGFDSVPADITSWLVATHIREKLSVGTSEVLGTLQNIKGQISGGTIATILSLMDSYSLRWIAESSDPYCISPIPRSVQTASTHPDLQSKILGVRQHPELGVLTDTPQSAADVPLVHRSWGLLGAKLYGERFHYSAWMRAKSVFRGTLIHFALMFAAAALIIKPVRVLARKLVTQPGNGPDETTRKDNFVYVKTLGQADEPQGRQAQATFKYQGDMYALTALLMIETAYVLLNETKTEAHRLKGIVTPATLGKPYVERIRKAGVDLGVELLD